MKKFSLSILILLNLNYGFAQIDNATAQNLQEKMYVHTDNNFYTTGEIIWFALYVFEAQKLMPFYGSKTAYVELISPAGESIIQQKIKLDSARGSGSIYLPLDLVSGNYELKVYTAWMKNYGMEHYCSQALSIVNPFEKLRPAQLAVVEIDKDTLFQSASEKPDYRKSNKRNKNIQINSDKKLYSKREKISLTLQSPDKIPGFYSIAVFRTDSLSGFPLPDILHSVYLSTPESENNEIPEFSVRYLPELEGQNIQFKIKDSGNNPIAGEKAYLSIPGNNFEFYTTKSDASGVLNFIVDHFYGNDEIAISLEKDTNYTIEYISPFVADFKNEQGGLILSENSLEALKKRSLNMQVQNVFAKDHIVKTTIPSEKFPFYGKADKTYLLDDYTRFSTMQEVMIEFIPEVQVRKRADELQLRVYEIPHARFFDGHPLFLVNGIPVKDVNKLLQTDPLSIEKIEIVARKFLWGNSYFEGIISYTSYPDEEINKPLEDVAYRKEIDGYAPNRIFYSPIYADDNGPSNIPDYRNLLYWNANLKISRSKSLDFYTGDRTGVYWVILQGVDEAGNFSTSKYYFEVVE